MGTLDDTYTKALLHFDGTDASTTFTDESGKSWSASGNAQLDTAQKKFGTASLLLDGTGDYISSADSADWTWGSGSGTLDCWVRINSLWASNDYQCVWSQYADADNYILFRLGDVSGTHYIGFVNRVGASTTIQVTKSLGANFSTGAWYHVAWVKNTNDWMLYVDGAQVSTTATDADAMSNIAASAQIGAFGAVKYFNGWIDELRWTSGVARWTASSFTLADVPYGGGRQFRYVITNA